MLVQDRPTVPAEPLVNGSPDAGVIEDARSRQRRHRRAGAALTLAVALAVLAYAIAGGGDGSGGARPPVAKDGASFVQTTSLRMPRGRTTFTFLVKGIAGHAFDVRFNAPASAALAVTTNIGTPLGTGPTFHTLTDRQDCRTIAAEVSCLVHFAAGGTPGGTWRWTVTKSSIPAARVRISVASTDTSATIPAEATTGTGLARSLRRVLRGAGPRQTAANRPCPTLTGRCCRTACGPGLSSNWTRSPTRHSASGWTTTAISNVAYFFTGGATPTKIDRVVTCLEQAYPGAPRWPASVTLNSLSLPSSPHMRRGPRRS
jgi:hypothetical protein